MDGVKVSCDVLDVYVLAHPHPHSLAVGDVVEVDLLHHQRKHLLLIDRLVL